MKTREVDVSALVPEARPLVQEAAGVYLAHLGRWFIGLVAYGSAVTGGVVPGCSDIDLDLYLDDAAFVEEGQLPLDLCLAIRRDTSQIDTAPFRCIQCFAYPPRPPAGIRVQPLPGNYSLVMGTLPVVEATTEQLCDESREWLANLTPPIPAGLLLHAGRRPEADVEELKGWVWGTVRAVVTLKLHQAFAKGLPKEQLIALLPAETPMGREIRAYHAAVMAFYPGQASIEAELAMVEHGVLFLREAKRWWDGEG